MSKPIIDKGEISIDFPEKYYYGTFSRDSTALYSVKIGIAWSACWTALISFLLNCVSTSASFSRSSVCFSSSAANAKARDFA